MRTAIRTMIISGIFLLAFLTAGCGVRQEISFADENIPAAAGAETEAFIIILDDNLEPPPVAAVPAGEADQPERFINPEGLTLETRILTPAGYTRVAKEIGSFQGYLRRYEVKAAESPVLLYDGREKANQSAHAAVFAMPVFDSDLQQCADSIMRIYAEYFWSMGDYQRIAFHLTNGFLMDYPSWRDGNRISVNGNHVEWVKKAGYDESQNTFLSYLRCVMAYAGTLSLDEESTPVDIGAIAAGDMFIKGGSPGHCVMVADVAKDKEGNYCFLLAQGYMPAQEFHILKNPLHEEDPWYYTDELTYPLVTPEYVFQEGSLKRWSGFMN